MTGGDCETAWDEEAGQRTGNRVRAAVPCTLRLFATQEPGGWLLQSDTLSAFLQCAYTSKGKHARGPWSRKNADATQLPARGCCLWGATASPEIHGVGNSAATLSSFVQSTACPPPLQPVGIILAWGRYAASGGAAARSLHMKMAGLQGGTSPTACQLDQPALMHPNGVFLCTNNWRCPYLTAHAITRTHPPTHPPASQHHPSTCQHKPWVRVPCVTFRDVSEMRTRHRGKPHCEANSWTPDPEEEISPPACNSDHSRISDGESQLPDTHRPSHT